MVIDWPVVNFTYGTHRRVGSTPLTSGFNHWKVDETHDRPCRYSGMFTDHFEVIKFEVDGWKVTDEPTLQALKDPKRRRSAILDLYSQHKKELFHADSREGMTLCT